MANGRGKKKRSGYVSFYKRKLLFFVLVACLTVGGIAYLRSNNIQADTTPILSSEMVSATNIRVSVEENGSIKIDGESSSKRVSILPDFDEVRLPILDASGEDYDLVRITLTLPASVANSTEHEILAIHGVASATSYVKDEQTIVYEAESVPSVGTVSIIAKMPKGTIAPPVNQEIKNSLSGVRSNFWFISAVLLPALTVIFMVLLVLYQTKRQRIDTPDKEIDFPPMAIPPAIVGVLFNQKVRSREVAATLIDLAIRGDIVIIDRERGFAFGKGKFDQRLLGYEKILLSKIFQKSLSSDRMEIERRINNHFYSKKISIVSAGMYALSTRLGYFKTNPQKIHAKYKLIGLATLILGLIGFVLSLKMFTNPPYIVFFWVGMMLASIVIIISASHIPIRSVLGQEALTNWYAFRKFLANPDPIGFEYETTKLFERYLPYAIVLNCEAAWAKRFGSHNFEIPKWFLTEKVGLGLDDFCLALFPIISYVSRSLVALREPGFE